MSSSRMSGNGYFLKAKGFHGCHESLQSNGGLKQSPSWKREGTTKNVCLSWTRGCENK